MSYIKDLLKEKKNFKLRYFYIIYKGTLFYFSFFIVEKIDNYIHNEKFYCGKI